MNSVIWIAVVLVVIWLVIRLIFAITSAALHILWIIGLILLVVWLGKKFL